MTENNSGDKGNTSSGNAPRKPPETPKPQSIGKYRRDGQDNQNSQTK